MLMHQSRYLIIKVQLYLKPKSDLKCERPSTRVLNEPSYLDFDIRLEKLDISGKLKDRFGSTLDKGQSQMCKIQGSIGLRARMG